MVRLSDGDRTAFDALLDHLWPVILAFASRAAGTNADAEDIAQEVFFKLCARIADFDRSRDGASWAFAIASYEIMTHRRRQHRRREDFDETALSTQGDGSASPEERVLANEIERAFEQAVGALTEEDRRSLGLGGAEPTGTASGAQRKRKQRALERLRGLWRHIYGES